MAALSTERNTLKVGCHPIVTELLLPMKANTKAFRGGLAVIDAGYAAPGRTALNLIAVGRFNQTVDNTGGAAGALLARVEPGLYVFGNSTAGDLIAQADVGADCFIVDDQTVAKTNGSNTRSRAGKIVAVDSTGVTVQLGLGF